MEEIQKLGTKYESDEAWRTNDTEDQRGWVIADSI